MTAKGRKASYRITLRLPKQICRRVWDAAVMVNQFGWTFDLRTYNLVPYDSPIFYFCEIGDLATVQRLLLDGEAGILDIRVELSARDVRGYATLLEARLTYWATENTH